MLQTDKAACISESKLDLSGWVVFQQAEIQAAAEKKKQELGYINHGLDTPAGNKELCAWGP